MAKILLGTITEVVLTKLILLGNERITRLKGVNEDLQKLTKQFKIMKALLYDAEKKFTTNKAIEVWLKRLDSVSNDANNLLDDISYYRIEKKFQKERKDKVCIHFSSSNSLVLHFKMFFKTKRIIFQIDKIHKNANQIELRPVEIINLPSELEITNPFVDDSKIIGRDDDLWNVIDLLLSSCSNDGIKSNLFVLGIVGMGGVGKTTLSKLLIHHYKVKNHCEKIIWTCVSIDFDIDRILKDVLQFLTRESSQLTNREEIVKGLSTQLEGKRFLLVLDDVWNESYELWECMKNCLELVGGSKESMIVVTTQNELVVEVMNGLHNLLGVLSNKHSQELFEKIAFSNGRVRKTPELGQKIVDRCGGLPLAIKTMGGLMSTLRDHELEW